jgi:hypothetical protein
MKIKSILIFVVCLFSCTTQPTAVKTWFPEIENHGRVGYYTYGAIGDYIHNFRADDINVARDAVTMLLSFNKKAIAAFHENIERAYAIDISTVQRPAMINEALTLVEDTGMPLVITVWDVDLQEFRRGAGMGLIWELVLIFSHSYLNNMILNHWFSLTGELLGEFIDLEALWDKLLQLRESL